MAELGELGACVVDWLWVDVGSVGDEVQDACAVGLSRPESDKAGYADLDGRVVDHWLSGLC